MHEHQVGATSWKMDVMVNIINMKYVGTVVGYQCQFALETRGQAGETAPARKRTRLMSNSAEIFKQLGKLCPGDHVHQHLCNDRVEKAAIYPR